ncbi:hypothetical protein HDR60_03305 [bacterium]|nr:hypothetical protein [bacterium]
MSICCKCPVVMFEGGIPPVYKTKGAACADLALPNMIMIGPNKALSINLKIGFDIPEGMKVVMYPRSSLFAKYSILMPVSVIDSDYKDKPVHAFLYNCSDKPVRLEAGERVCQIECVPAVNCVSWDRNDVERDGGLGSTGK